MLKNETVRKTIKHGDDELTLVYFLTKSEMAERKYYGAGVKIEENGEEAVLCDISGDMERVMEFIDLLSSNTVTPVTLYDVFYDWAG